jgi:hypothetical protein
VPAPKPMSIFHVESRLNNAAAPILIRMTETTLHKVRHGSIPPISSGTDHIVVSEQIANLLRGFSSDGSQFIPVSILDVTTGVTLAEHFEVLPHFEIQSSDIFIAPHRGTHMWHYAHRQLFVSGSLRAEIERLKPGEFDFSQGFSNFAG